MRNEWSHGQDRVDGISRLPSRYLQISLEFVVSRFVCVRSWSFANNRSMIIIKNWWMKIVRQSEDGRSERKRLRICCLTLYCKTPPTNPPESPTSWWFNKNLQYISFYKMTRSTKGKFYESVRAQKSSNVRYTIMFPSRGFGTQRQQG